MDNDRVISTLNDLIECCKDGEQGFRTAAEGVKDPQLRSLFEEFSLQRQQFARELQREVISLGGDAEEAGSISGAAHRGWISVKSAVTGGDEKSIVSECERGEDSAVNTYREALKEPIPGNVRMVVERQMNQVKAAHDRIRALEVKAEADAHLGRRTT